MSETELPASCATATTRGRSILIAEDNAMNQKVLRQQLRLLGQSADIAANGREALQLWQAGDYAMLITDLHMPLMDGYELTSTIRAAENGTLRRPIVAFTANVLKGEAERCLATGMDDYLAKPVQLACLKAMLARWLPLPPDNGPAADGEPAVAVKATPSITLDVNVLKDLIGTDELVVCDFLQEFRRGTRPIAAALRLACQAGEMALAGALAHKLKSSCRSVGAAALARLCNDLEAAGKGGDSQAVAVLLPAFEQELVSVEYFLQTYLNVQAEAGYASANRQDIPHDC